MIEYLRGYGSHWLCRGRLQKDTLYAGLEDFNPKELASQLTEAVNRWQGADLQSDSGEFTLSYQNGNRSQETVSGTFLKCGNAIYMQIAGISYEFQVLAWSDFSDAAGQFKSEMPGKITKVFGGAGDTVKKGDRILILEAMKMENPVIAEADGKIAAIHVAEGDLVQSGTVLAELEYDEES